MAIEPVIERIETLDEFAFVCDEVEADLDLAILRTYPLYGRSVGVTTETLCIDHLDPAYIVKLQKGAAGILHIYEVTYADGSRQDITTNTVFPKAKYRTDYGPRPIAFAECASRLPV